MAQAMLRGDLTRNAARDVAPPMKQYTLIGPDAVAVRDDGARHARRPSRPAGSTGAWTARGAAARDRPRRLRGQPRVLRRRADRDRRGLPPVRDLPARPPTAPGRSAASVPLTHTTVDVPDRRARPARRRRRALRDPLRRRATSRRTRRAIDDGRAARGRAPAARLRRGPARDVRPAAEPALRRRRSSARVWDARRARSPTARRRPTARSPTARGAGARRARSAPPTARNPLPLVVPCHRVIGARGALTGYAGGLDRKRTLLDARGRAAGGVERAARAAQRGRLDASVAQPVSHEPSLPPRPASAGPWPSRSSPCSPAPRLLGVALGGAFTEAGARLPAPPARPRSW